MKKAILATLFVLIFAGQARAAEMKTYYPNGKVQMEMTDKAMKTYFESGKLMREQNLVDGSWKQYDENGKVVAEGKA